jgi:hypothetical protein
MAVERVGAERGCAALADPGFALDVLTAANGSGEAGWRTLGAWDRLGAVMRGRALVPRDGEGAAVNADRRGRVAL